MFGDFYEEGRIRGGDRFCVYHGTYVIENFGLRASLAVTRYRTEEPRPVFPGDGVMKLAGTIEAGVERQVIELAVGGTPAQGAAEPASHPPRRQVRAGRAKPAALAYIRDRRTRSFGTTCRKINGFPPSRE